MYNKELIITWDKVYEDSIKLAKTIKLTKFKFDRIVAITKGGMVPALLIAEYLNINNIDTICVQSYDNKEQKDVEIIKFPKMSSAENWLIIDDLVDTGNTIDKIISVIPKIRYRYSTIDYFGVLYAKPLGKNKLIVDSYVEDVEQDVWIKFPWEKK